MEIDICHVLWIDIEVIDFSVLLIFKFKQYKNATLPTFCITRKLVGQETQGSQVLRNAIFTARNEAGARLCFYRHLWFCPQEGEYLTRYTPRPGTPPGPGAPQDQVHPPRPGTPPRTRYTSWTRYPPRTRYTPPDQVHPPRTRYTPWDQVHPPGTRYTPQDQVHQYQPGPGTPPSTRYTSLPRGPGTPPRTRYTLRDQVHPPRPGTQPSPWDQADMVYARAVRILLECILVQFKIPVHFQPRILVDIPSHPN